MNKQTPTTGSKSSATDSDHDAPRSEQRRETIVEYAAVLFAENGIRKTTVRDIGNAAGILSGSLYYHFDSKESIVREIIRRFLVGLIDRYEAVMDEDLDARRQFEGLIRASYETIDHDHRAARIYQNEFAMLRELPDLPEFQTLTGRFQKIWMETIDRGVEAGVFRADVDTHLFYRLARDAIWFTARWYQPGAGHDVDRLSRTATTVLLDGFATSPAAAGI